MPKILIKEDDLTLPGTPDSYSNYKVLITGVKTTTDSTGKIKPDSNGVYEFSSYQDFKNTIGLAGPELTSEFDQGLYHCGNQMAYELLKMGYSIIYKPIVGDDSSSAIHKMANAEFWEVFKDKASYDFRFISHGLLKSSEPTESYQSNKNRLTEVTEAQRIAAKLTEDLYGDFYDDITRASGMTKSDFDALELQYRGFVTENPEAEGGYAAYSTLADAQKGIDAEYEALTEIIKAYEKQSLVNEAVINNINVNIANLAKYVSGAAENGRGDCIALLELDENSYNSSASSESSVSQIIRAVKALASSGINENNGSYCALTTPSVTYTMPDSAEFANNKTLPGAFHYLACFMSSLKSGFREWYAAAGYSRGVSSYAIKTTTVKLGEIAINALEPRYVTNQETDPNIACNVIAYFRGSYYLWGNRTAYPLGDYSAGEDLVAQHFLNIRQLCTTIKKQLYIACRRFTFDPNSDTLWVNFVNAIKPTLEEMKADQGIRDYKILKVYEEKPKKATLKAKIRIIPIEAVEDFDIEVRLEDTFGETTVVAD